MAQNDDLAGKIKVWLDDLRDPADYGCPDHVWIKDPLEAIQLITANLVISISFDHDLGVFDAYGKEITGNSVAKVIEEMAFFNRLKEFPAWNVHSANPEGERNIVATMQAAERFFWNVRPLEMDSHDTPSP